MDKIKIKETFDYLYLNENKLSGSQLNFIDSCKKQFRKNKSLSEAQVKVLTEIKKYMNVSGQPIRFSGALIK